MNQANLAAERPIIVLNNVHKSFGALKVLDGVSFTVTRGEVLVLIGRSGSGAKERLVVEARTAGSP